MTRSRRSAALMLIAATVGVGAVPHPAYARGKTGGYNYEIQLYDKHDAHEALAIGAGVTTGVLAIVGGALWYYFHNRNSSKDEPVSTPPTAE